MSGLCLVKLPWLLVPGRAELDRAFIDSCIGMAIQRSDVPHRSGGKVFNYDPHHG
jgi:hypothetical protein